MRKEIRKRSHFRRRQLTVDKKNAPQYNYSICTAEVFMLFKKTGEKDGYTVLSDGKSRALFDFIEMTSVDGEEYAALYEKDTDGLVILRIIDDSSEEIYETVDDDETFERICDAFANEFPDEFDF